MAAGIEILVLGDYGPFAEAGKGIGYQLFVNGDNYLIDLGAPFFQQLGADGLGRIAGAIVTHCHDDHKRWFTDLALQYMYTPSLRRRLKLFTSDIVAGEVKASSDAALKQSLDAQSKRVVDLAYEDYIEHVAIGPRARYRIEGRAGAWRVVDSQGHAVPPERAKVVVSAKTAAPRLLFRDPDSGEWVEPETYYPFSSEVFYEADRRPIVGDGYTIDIINAPVWHGLPNFGLVIEAGGEKLILSSDTMHNLPLWQSLYAEKRTPKADLAGKAFLDAELLVGDINDYIERTWSEARYREAVAAFEGAAVLHDITSRYGVVHTEYHGLAETVLDPEHTLLSHSPDRFTAIGWKLVRTGKRYRVENRRFVEVGRDGASWPLDADVYHRHDGRFFAGYRDEAGAHCVYAQAGYHSVDKVGAEGRGEPLFRLKLFEDVAGAYLPSLGEAERFYRARPDGRVELVSPTADGSHGRVIENLRPRGRSVSPEEMARLLRPEATAGDDAQAELRELQRSMAAMRDSLELQAANRQDEIQRAVAAAQAEIVQLRQTIAALRDELEKAHAAAEAMVNEAVKAANAEIVQLREGAGALRDALERKDVEAANERQEAVSLLQQELAQLRATASALRDQIETMKNHGQR
ncbi:MAG: hypothetical protein HY850_02560 [Betaproteobacteria bacterium]|nr:hypothetical protein [Betaproteobacteria bacterium]